MNIKPTPTLQAVQPSDPGPTLDPFDPANLRLNQSFAETALVKKLLTTVPVRKPSAQDFVRVRPEPEFRENFPIIEIKDEREEYIVTTSLVPELAGEFVTKTLFLAINRQGTPFFWPVRLPAPDGRDLDWWRSSREAAELAMKSWVRVRANMNLGANYSAAKAGEIGFRGGGALRRVPGLRRCRADHRLDAHRQWRTDHGVKAAQLGHPLGTVARRPVRTL
jgi:hypothetical protein